MGETNEMLKSHEKFHSSGGKRLVLIADDEQINRSILEAVLESEYEIIYADNGVDALDLINRNADVLSLVLLDLQMPRMSGIEVLKQIRAGEETRNIPVIVETTDQAAEVESLNLGAEDFISKPYPRPDVIQARVRRTIELSEDRETIHATERDHLTGLYNKEYFFQYAQQYDVYHKEKPTDAIVIDVNHFRILNERYGKEYGDEILRRIGQRIREMIQDEDGIVCRREADAFLVYCLHGIDYEALLEHASVSIERENEAAGGRVRLRMGVYANADKSIDIERRFDRAKMAADTIRNNYTQKVAAYDDSLHESELYTEQLVGDFQAAIEGEQFTVFYQPKFDIRGEQPVLSSAEALVRWEHPSLGMISPGVFIPLFEENGMILQLDHYVWRQAAAQIRDWQERYGMSVPVSVNMSRIDMFDEKLVETMQGILEEFDLTPNEFLLEITESAYTDDSELIISTVSALRDLGFRIEMDDFGTGYSSLGMLSNLPIDALKLDMVFVRNAFSERQDVKMLELILELAQHLDVPVIAEGVETREQMNSLKTMGCDLAQGYYFSKPVPAAEFDRFIEEKLDQIEKGLAAAGAPGRVREVSDLAASALQNLSTAMTSDFESVYYVDTETGYYMEFGTHLWREDLQLQKGGDNFFEDIRRNFSGRLHPDDRKKISVFLDSDYIMQRLDTEEAVSMTFRLLRNGEPVYYLMQIVRSRTSGEKQIVIGLRNADEQVLPAAAELERQLKDPSIKELAQALADQFESIYYIDQDTDAYTIYQTGGRHGQLALGTSGVRFYEDCQYFLHRFVDEADRKLVSRVLRRGNVLAEIQKKGEFTVDYRLLFDGQPVFYRMTGFMPPIGDGHHFLIGVRNVNEEKAHTMQFASAEEVSATYARIAQVLAQDFFTVYYVNIENDHYTEYSMQGADHRLKIEREGTSFFSKSVQRINSRVQPGDRERVETAFAKENLLEDMKETGAISITYEVLEGGRSMHVAAKVMQVPDDPDHIVIGIRSIEAQVRRKNEYAAAMEEQLTYSRIARALSREYFSIYLVDMETDDYIEFSSQDAYSELPIDTSGKNFFEETRINAERLAYPEDIEKAKAFWHKERLLPLLEKGDTVTAAYRLMIGGEPTRIGFKIMWVNEEDKGKHIIVAVSNLDAQAGQEEKES